MSVARVRGPYGFATGYETVPDRGLAVLWLVASGVYFFCLEAGKQQSGEDNGVGEIEDRGCTSPVPLKTGLRCIECRRYSFPIVTLQKGLQKAPFYAIVKKSYFIRGNEQVVVNFLNGDL